MCVGVRLRLSSSCVSRSRVSPQPSTPDVSHGLAASPTPKRACVFPVLGVCVFAASFFTNGLQRQVVGELLR